VTNAPKVKQFLVYTLSDPRTQEVRYVGQSREWLSRPYEHFVCRGSSEKDDWVRLLRAVGDLPDITIIEQFDAPDSLNEREDFWIEHFWSSGSPLLNLRLGQGKGRYIRPMPKQHRENIGRKARGRKDTEETRLKKSIAARGSRNPMWKGGISESS
jgi:hypothetical protein